MKIRGIIWGNTLEEAKEELLRFKHNYIAFHQKVVHEVDSPLAGVIEFECGDLWEAKKIDEKYRGIRCNISYISSKIDKEFVNTIIIPCTTAPPYHGIYYY